MPTGPVVPQPSPVSSAAPVVDPRSGRRTDDGPELDLLTLLDELQESFAATIPATDPDAVVPACGGWLARELVVHVAGVHHWAAGMAVDDRSRSDELPAPEDGALATFYRRHAVELRGTLVDAGPDGAARTLLGTGPASFWWRRQVHETLVHLHDLRAARLGSGPAAAAAHPSDVAPEVWADAVDEVVTMFQPRQVRLGRTAPLDVPVRVVATDLGWSWTLGGAEHVPPDDTASVSASVSAPAQGLALVLWGRLGPAEAGAQIDGDEDAVRRTLAAPIVP